MANHAPMNRYRRVNTNAPARAYFAALTPSPSLPLLPDQTHAPASTFNLHDLSRRGMSWHSTQSLTPKRRKHRLPRVTHLTRWLIAVLCCALAVYLWSLHIRRDVLDAIPAKWRQDPSIQQALQPVSSDGHDSERRNPEQWLRLHSATHKDQQTKTSSLSRRPKAAIISLVRNEELEGILQSMRQLEYHWNCRYNYPWIFFNEKPFSDEFKAATSNATSAATFYHIVPKSHWSTPPWIDEERYMDSLDYLGAIGVGKGYMLSYRNMCRWNSGFFYKHPALASYDFYWRVEPDVHFFCDIPYDPFRFMADNGLIYGFNMNILDDARSFASLWRKTMEFVELRSDLVHPDADLDWLMDETNGGEYNNCQFFSNFEIGDLRFFRSEANEAYFEYLDHAGGFYYERFGDAPVHTLSVALFAPKSSVWFFRDIGYQHDIARHCPRSGVEMGMCDCEPTGLDENFFKLVPMESPQRKPVDTCIRQWLGGEWLDKKDGWSQEAERVMGGDGYGGYVNSGL